MFSPRIPRRTLLAGAVLPLLAGCRKPALEGSGLKLGLVLSDGSSAYDQAVRKAVEEYSRDKGMELQIRDGRGRGPEQVLALEELAQQGANVVLLLPVPGADLNQVVRKLEGQKTYVVLLATDGPEVETATVVRFNPTLTGRLAAEFLAVRLTGGGRVVALAGPGRAPAWFEELKAAADANSASLQITPVVSREKEPADAVAAALRQHPQPAALVLANDALTLAAVQAVQGKSSVPLLIGYGGDQPVLAELKREGSPLALVLAVLPQRIGLVGARQAFRIVSNAAASPRINLPVQPVVRESAGRYPGWTGPPPKEKDMVIPWKSNLQLVQERE